MEGSLHHFHTLKDVVLIGSASRKVKATDKSLGTELVKKPKVDEKTQAETWTPSNKRSKMNT
jgi:hypothetical protein